MPITSSNKILTSFLKDRYCWRNIDAYYRCCDLAWVVPDDERFG